MACVDSHCVPQALRTQLPFFSKCAQRSWYNHGAAAAPPVLSFLGGTKVKFRAPLGRIINSKSQKSRLSLWFWCCYHVVFLLARLHAVRGTLGTGLDSSSPRVIWASSPPPLSLDYDRIWVASFHPKAFTSVFKNSLIKSQFGLISSQLRTMEKFLENEMRWLGRNRERQRAERWKAPKPCFTHFGIWQEASPESRRFFCAMYGRVRVGPGESEDLKIYYKLVERTHLHFFILTIAIIPTSEFYIFSENKSVCC